VRKRNRHIVDASIKYLAEMRQRTGFRHQLIAVACSVDHAKQVRSRPLTVEWSWSFSARVVPIFARSISAQRVPNSPAAMPMPGKGLAFEKYCFQKSLESSSLREFTEQ
jgi:hypothetical protein